MEAKRGMIRAEETLREIFESLGDEDPDKARLWRVLQGVEYRNKSPNFPPPTQEQLQNLRDLTDEQLHESCVGQYDLLERLSFEYESVSREERSAVHQKIMDALKVIEDISQEQLERSESSRRPQTE